jgi:hypothetical protein
MVCTETYHRRVNGDEEHGKGSGVVWEAWIIRQLLYDAGAVGAKFVPVLFSDASSEQIPTPIKGGTHYLVDTEYGYEDLYRRLTGQPRLLRPALGTIRPLPTRRRQWSEGSMEAASSSPAPKPPPTADHAAWVRRGTPVGKLWRFLRQEKNRVVLGWFGGGLVVIAGGVWAAVTFFYPPHPPPLAPEVNVQAPGGVAAGRDIRGSTITVHPSAPPAGSPGNADPAPDARRCAK